MTRVAFIGAGSVTFTRELLTDLFAYEDLRGLQVALHDIDAERLETAAAVARRLDADLGARAQITTHAERRAALDGADFAINMVQVGMHAATVEGPRAPRAPRAAPDDRRHARGRRHLPRAAHDPRAARLGEDLAAVSPDAWLLNYTNPMAILCQAYAEGSPHKQIVGLCHSVQNTTRELAELCGVPFEDVSSRARA